MIKLDSQIISFCMNFAQNSVSTNVEHYAKRKQFNVGKITRDIFYGKLGECIAYFELMDLGMKKVTVPDFQIYPKNLKSFEADLKYGLFNIHVKTQHIESAEKYGISWVFQKNDPVIQKSSEYDIFCGVLLHSEDTGELILRKKVSELKVESTKLTKFNSNKVCIYLKSNE